MAQLRLAGVIVGVTVLMMAPGATKAFANDTGADTRLIVRWYSLTISSDDFRSMRRLAEDILGRAGISVSWCECSLGLLEEDHPRADCAHPIQGTEVIVRVVPLGPEEADDRRTVLGYSLVDLRERGGTISTVYNDRVIALAHSAHVDAVEVLARAVVHELGHLLLGTSQHARHGLMRAGWSIDELRSDSPLDWVFSNEEARTMKKALTTRAARDFATPCLRD